LRAPEKSSCNTHRGCRQKQITGKKKNWSERMVKTSNVCPGPRPLKEFKEKKKAGGRQKGTRLKKNDEARPKSLSEKDRIWEKIKSSTRDLSTTHT